MKRASIFGFVLAMAGLLLAFTAGIGVEAVPAERPYTFTTIDFPGAVRTFAMSNNAKGDVVGYYADQSGKMHGFLLSRGVFTTLDFPGDGIAWTQANAIGPAGEIVGTYSLKSPAPAGNVHGFLLSEGDWSTVDYPEGIHTMAGGLYAILPDGTMLGCFHDGFPAATAMYGYVTGPSGTSSFAYPADTPFAMYYGATPDGKTRVGMHFSGGVQHGFVEDNGNVVSFDVPGRPGTQALGINAAREIAGVYKVGTAAHGYIAKTRGSASPADWDFTLIDYPGASQTIVRGINSAGDLAGYYVDASGRIHGFAASRTGR